MARLYIPLCFAVGDIVETVKGCRYFGPPGEMEILKLGGKWRNYDTALCEKPNGMKSSFLLKNLRKVRM